MHSSENNNLTPKEGELVYHLNEVEATLIDFIRDRGKPSVLDNLDLVYQMATFGNSDDGLSPIDKDALLDLYVICEILKERTEQVKAFHIQLKREVKED